jgi:hypothetical protein
MFQNMTFTSLGYRFEPLVAQTSAPYQAMQFTFHPLTTQ